MTVKQIIQIDSVQYKLHEKSVVIPQAGISIFYNREPEQKDIDNLARLVKLGQDKKSSEIKGIVNQFTAALGLRKIMF